MKQQLIRIAGVFCILLMAAAAMAGTWSPNNFFYQPSLEARGSTEKDSFDTGLNRVDAHLGQYKTLGDPGYSTLAEALTTIGINNVTLTMPAGTVTIASNTTIGNNIALRVFKGGKFNVNGGVILAINGPVDAGPYQIFSGTGTVTLGGVSTIYDVWYAVPPTNPEGNIAAPIGSRFVKTAGSAPLVYVKESGTGTSGWVAGSGGSGAAAFTGLTDVPGTYSDQAGKALRVNANSNGLEFYNPPVGGVRPFITLGETGYVTLSQALSTIGSTKTTMIIPAEAGVVPITCNTTIAANVDLRVLKGARLDVANGFTLNINGSIEAGPYQIFSWSGTGTISLAKSHTKRFPLQWWGGVSGLTNDCGPALNKALESCVLGQAIVISGGQNDNLGTAWRIATPVVRSTGTNQNVASIEGDDTLGATPSLYCDVGPSNDVLTVGGEGYQTNGCWLKNLNFTGPANSCRSVLVLTRWNNYGGTKNVNIAAGTSDWAVKLVGNENCDWDFRLGTYHTLVISGGAGQMANGVLMTDSAGYGGTYNKIRILKTASIGATQALKIENVKDVEVLMGDIENCYLADGASYHPGYAGGAAGGGDGSDYVSLYSGATTRCAQTFTLSEETAINNIGAMLAKNGNPNGAITLAIYATSGGAPTGAALATASTTTHSDQMNGGNHFPVIFEFPGGFTLAAGTYALSVEYGSGDASNYVKVDTDALEPAGTGTCYTYNGSWTAQTYDMLYAVNARASLEIYNSLKVKVNHIHYEGNWWDVLIDKCLDIHIDDGGMNWVKVARSRNVTIGGACEIGKLSVDPVSNVTLGQVKFSTEGLDADYGNVSFLGRMHERSTYRTVANIRGNALANYAPNSLLNRWQAAIPDFWHSYISGGTIGFTRSGVGQADTTRHQAQDSAKVVVSGAAGSIYQKLDKVKAPDMLRGGWVTWSLWVKLAAGSTFAPGSNPYLKSNGNWPARANSTAHNIGDAVLGTGSIPLICVGAGTTNSSEPSYAADGEYTVDGTVTWLRWGQAYGPLNGGSLTDAVAGKWQRPSVTFYIPPNGGTNPELSFYIPLTAGGGNTTLYVAESTLVPGNIPPAGLLPGLDEHADGIFVDGNRINFDAYIPTSASSKLSGKYAGLGDICFNNGSATPLANVGKWRCTTAGINGSGSVWTAIDEVP